MINFIELLLKDKVKNTINGMVNKTLYECIVEPFKFIINLTSFPLNCNTLFLPPKIIYIFLKFLYIK